MWWICMTRFAHAFAVDLIWIGHALFAADFEWKVRAFLANHTWSVGAFAANHTWSVGAFDADLEWAGQAFAADLEWTVRTFTDSCLCIKGLWCSRKTGHNIKDKDSFSTNYHPTILGVLLVLSHSHSSHRILGLPKKDNRIIPDKK